MPQAALEKAVVDSVAERFDESVLVPAIDRALELVDERREVARQRRSAHEEALTAIRTEEARLIDAVRQGRGLNALVAALQNAQERRQHLESQLAAISSGAIDRLPDPERLRPMLMSGAADVRGVLARRDQETRRVLQAAFA